jgi:hypothetical protein
VPYPFDPAPATLWTVTLDDRLASCAIAFVPNGVEARIMRNGKLLYACTFANGDDTLEWAEGERVETRCRPRSVDSLRAEPTRQFVEVLDGHLC